MKEIDLQNEPRLKNLAAFCKDLRDYLWIKNKQDFVYLEMSKFASQYNMPYWTVIPKIMREKGIIQISKKLENGGYAYKWISTTEPNIHMATALLKEAKKSSQMYNSTYHKNKISIETEETIAYAPIKEKKIVYAVVNLNGRICIIKGELKIHYSVEGSTAIAFAETLGELEKDLSFKQ
jgi:hypothetical protein